MDGNRDAAPRWLYESEVYGLWYAGLATPEQIEPYKAFPFIDWGQPALNVEWVKPFREIGIRSIAYVSFYKAADIPQVEEKYGWEGGSPGVEECVKNPLWRAVDLSEHPEWIHYAEDGSIKRPFNRPDYQVGWHQVCTNVAGYTEAVLEGVKGIMDMGFDGLFIDNVHPEADCFGPKHGKHEHLHPEKDNVETYKMLLAEVRSLVKSYGQDKVCVLNSGGLREEYGPYGDAMMWESFVYARGKRRHDWQQIREAADKWKPFIDGGKPILALSTIGGETPEELKQNTFYTYACARLSGFLWGRSSAFDSVRLGMPAGDIQEAGGIHYRLYQKGAVAVNPESEARSVEIPVSGSEFLDLFSEEALKAKDGKLSVNIPADSGRVYIAR